MQLERCFYEGMQQDLDKEAMDVDLTTIHRALSLLKSPDNGQRPLLNDPELLELIDRIRRVQHVIETKHMSSGENEKQSKKPKRRCRPGN